MQLRPDQLANSLKRGLAPVYFIFGDEPLLVQESSDLIRRSATAAGFTEREVYHADNSFSWETLLETANALSLFAEKKIIELRLPTGKPNDKGKALLQYTENPSPDTLLLITGGKLEAATKKTKWYTAVEKAGVAIPIWPIEDKQLPSWISQRLSQNGLQVTNDALQLMVERVEGNLLAAAQEIEKLKLFSDGDTINIETIAEVVSNSARYDVFNLVDKALRGDTAEAIRALNGLRAEATEPTIILWALSREIRSLYDIKVSIDNGMQAEAVFKKYRIWDKRKPLVKKALGRTKRSDFESMIELSSTIDCTIKGLNTGTPWDMLTSLVLSLAGRPTQLAS